MNESKSIIIAAIVYIVTILIIGIVGSYVWNNNPKIETKTEIDTVYVIKKDTIDNTDYKVIDSLKSELLIKELKLARIKEYNKIAAKGNNVKYLRGWINRVLEE